ncbi:MAG: glucosaminidase domain-containing protein [Saprospiraceae bacterium]
MGQSKWHFESEAAGYSTSGKTHTKKRTRQMSLEPLSAARSRTAEDLPLDILFRQIWIRLRRSWISLKFRIQSTSSILLSRSSLLKFSTLAIVAYSLLNTQRESQASVPGEMSLEGKSILTSSTEQPVANIPDRSKSIKPVKTSAPAAKTAPAPSKSAAPIGLKGLEKADAQTRAYITRFHKIAITEMHKYGVPASISLAQGLIESQAGRSKLAVANNNHFGMKCFAKNCKKGHCSNHTDDSHKDFFRKYDNAWESWRAHSIMISSGRYKKLKKHGRDYKKWAYGLKQVGYATDKTYAEKLIRVIQRYKLHQFDSQ